MTKINLGLKKSNQEKETGFKWSHCLKNVDIGKEMNINMYEVVKEIEKLTGKKFIQIEEIKKGESLKKSILEIKKEIRDKK